MDILQCISGTQRRLSSTRKSDVEKYLNEQLQKTGARYFDYYLCHAVTGENYKSLMKAEAFEEFKRFKNEGKIRHICISFHDTSEVLDQVNEVFDRRKVILADSGSLC